MFKKFSVSALGLIFIALLAFTGCAEKVTPGDISSEMSRSKRKKKENVLAVTSVVPHAGLQAGGQRIVIHGMKFPKDVSVFLGGVECSPVQVVSSQELTCVTGPKDTPGAVDLVLHSSGKEILKEARGFFYYTPTFAPYANSEAEAMRNGYAQRVRTGNYVTYLNIRGVPFDTSQLPADFMQSYRVNDAALAQRLQNYLGTPFVTGDVISLYEINAISDINLRDALRNDLAFIDPAGSQDDFVVTDVGMQLCSRPFLVTALSPAEDAYKEYLTERVIDEAAKLNWGYGTYARVAPGDADSGRFQRLLDAVAGNDEDAAVAALAEFHYSWDNYYGGARAAFRDAFLNLFVAKRFPSTAVRDIYFHFTLRCGQMY